MNRYGQMAMDHWKRWRPKAYSELENPVEFFTTLGEQVQDTILAAEDQAHPATTDYLQAVGQITAARLAAEEIALQEMVFLPVEPQMQDEELDRPRVVTSMGMPTDRSHPLWDLDEDPNVTEEQFRAAHQAWWNSLPSHVY